MICFSNVTREFKTPEQGTVVAVRDLTLTVADGETLCLIGPSGCGKTTTMRLVNRLIDPTSGTITVDGRDHLVSIGAFRTSAYDPATGDELGLAGYPDGFSNVPGPVFSAQHGVVYIATGFQQPSLLAVRAKRLGDASQSGA